MTARLRRHRALGLYRERRVRDGRLQPASIDGRRLLNFSSNDYLGLSQDPRVIEALSGGASRYGAGAGASELICGHTAVHAALEAELAEFTRRPRALVFSTGYMANLGMVTALAPRGAIVFQDRLNHASLIDAAVLARSRLRRYPHADVVALEALLAAAGAPSLVITDGVFSMDGDEAPLPTLARLCTKHAALLAIDDAHGFGVLGRRGAGLLDEHGLGVEDVPVLVGTFGKAIGVFGAFVAGSDTVIETLIQFARPYAYTTALPPAVAGAVLASVRIIRDEPERRQRLQARIAYFRTRAASRGVPLSASRTPIQPLPVGTAEAAVALSQRLYERGLLVHAIRPPTVPEGTARLRIALSAAHEPEHVDALVEALAQCL